jgi:hypothetical protein
MSTRVEMISYLGRLQNSGFTLALLLAFAFVACNSSSGVECARNADCAHSSAADRAGTLRCGAAADVYCLAGKCEAECGNRCQPVTTDVNPCPQPQLCKPVIPGPDGLSVCTIVPIACTGAADCPVYAPVTEDGGHAQWDCVDAICKSPSVSYGTN